MKASYLIVPIIAGSLVAGWAQRRTLSHLEAENAALEAKAAAAEPAPRRGDPGPSEAFQPSPGLVPLIARYIELQGRMPLSEEEGAELRDLFGKITPELRAMDKETSFGLTRRIIEGVTDPKERTQRIYLCTQFIIPLDPAAALEFIGSLDNFERDGILSQAFRSCAAKNPSKAVRWFDERLAAGDSFVRNSMVVGWALAAQIRTSPDAAVARMFSPEMQAFMRGTAWINSNLSRELRSPREHRAFIEALRKESLRQPDSETLKNFRTRYLGGMNQIMGDWTFDDATALLDAEYSAAEKLQMMYSIGTNLSMDEAPRWADWISRMQMPDRRDHIIGSFIGNWATSDPAGARRWLEKVPDGPARDSAVFGYVCRVAPGRPEEAGAAAMVLPKTEARRRSLSVTAKYWRKRDPAAFEAFRVKNGLGPIK